MCVFIVYLLEIITSIIIIVSKTKPNKSKYIISNKTASVIVSTPFSQIMQSFINQQNLMVFLNAKYHKYKVFYIKNYLI